MSTAPFRGLLIVVAALALSGCGGGGGGGGGSGATTPPFGGGPPLGPGQFGVQSGPTGGPIMGINAPVSLTFSKDVAPASATSATIKVVTIADPIGQATAPAGLLASLNVSVSGATVTLTPTVQFTSNSINFGFVANAFYEISFSAPASGTFVTSTAAEPIANSGTSFFFRTPAQPFDFNSGYPQVRAFFVDDPSAVILPPTFLDLDADLDLVPEVLASFTNEVEILAALPIPVINSTPARDILFVFKDAVIPTSVINVVDNSSPNLKVSINTATPPVFQPKTVPAQYTFLKQQGNLTLVRWKPLFNSYPPGAFLFVEVSSAVADLAGNTKFSVTGSPASDLAATLQVSGAPDVTLYSVTEPFDDTTFEDNVTTSAVWSSTDIPGFKTLAPVLGGGTGSDGPFIIDPLGTLVNPGETTLPPGALIDFLAKVVQLPTVETTPAGILPRSYNFSTMTLPVGWTLRPLFDRDGNGIPDPAEYLVQSPGHPLNGLGAPLVVRCTGKAQVNGTIDVSGPPGVILVRPETPLDGGFAAYLAQGATGGRALQAAGDGGDGGDVLFLDSTLGNIILPLVQGDPNFDASDGKLTGVTGKSSGLTASTLTDVTKNFGFLNTDPQLAAALANGEIRLQPNVGVGNFPFNTGTLNQPIDENHPTFVVTSAAGDTLTVDTSPPTGAMTQPGQNIGNGNSNIASTGDVYLLGKLAGEVGQDATPLQRGGRGAEPYVVVNNGATGVVTTGGAAGGGGGIFGGSTGQSDGPIPNPAVNQAGQGGISLDESAGALGGLGSISGTGRALSDTTFEVMAQTAGTPLAGLGGTVLAGCLLIPNSPNDGWMFEVVSFNAGTLTFTVSRILADAIDIGLTSPPGGPAGPDGPALAINGVVDFLLTPRLDIGGAGGGGTGVSVTGTVKSAVTVLPTLAPGAGGGGGGGSLLLEVASELTLGPASRLLATGGGGGIVSDVQAEFAGGGGGGGGNIVVRAGKIFQFFQGAVISVVGGDGGGGLLGGAKGGAGGSGFVRLENFADDLHLALAQLTSLVTPSGPTVFGQANFGRMLGLPQGVGQSRFYQTAVVNPEYQSVTVNYLSDTTDDGITEPFSWSFGVAGTTSAPGGFTDPPFRVEFNSVDSNESGFLDTTKVTDTFYEVSDLVSARVGLAFDPATGVVLYSVGEKTNQVHRLTPGTYAPAGVPKLLLPVIPTNGSTTLNIVSMAAGGAADELFLLERDTRRVHVIHLATAGFRRTITLPIALNGAMTYLPAPIDRLAFADNVANRVLLFEPRDATAGSPLTTNYAPLVPSAVFDVTRDGVPLDIEIVGLAHDAASQVLWCTDALSSRLFQISMAPGFEGVSATGLEKFSPLVDAAFEPVVPSGLAFDGTNLSFVHATNPVDSRIRTIDPATVDPFLVGASLSLVTFGVLLPETPLGIHDGRIFVRFRLRINGVHDAGLTEFRKVRIDDVNLIYSNSSF